MTTEVKFGDWINRAFELYKRHMPVLIVAALLALLLSGITFGVLAGPMMAGMALLALQIVDGKGKPEIGVMRQ